MDVQGFKSEKKILSRCLVTQGSKGGGFLYTLISIEVVWLPRIMSMPNLYHEITELHDPTEHKVVQFVDDSNNCIACNSLTDLARYTEDYLCLLKAFYAANK